MSPLPRERVPDSTLALLADPYRWIARRAKAHGTTTFSARLLGEETLLVTGPEAAARFYGGGLTRQGAPPAPILKVLQDEGSVTTLDGGRHRIRKALFVSLMTPERLAEACRLFEAELGAALGRWVLAGDVVFDDAIAEVITRSTCAWAGVPLAAAEAPRRSSDFQAMFDGAGSAGPRYVRAAIARARTERWMRGIVRGARSGAVLPAPGTALHAIATHEGRTGETLDDETVMTELVNVIRPTVAVGRFLTFAAMSLHAHPERLAELAEAPSASPADPAADGPERAVDDPDDPVWRFVQEVRRTAPFFPLVAGRAIDDLDWNGERLPAGRRVVLDLYGTNHDPSAWASPDTFDPARFAGWTGDPYRLIPQGAGGHATDHRCPGEWLTIALMRAGVTALAQRVTYEVPPQDLRVSLRRIPARPASGLVLRGFRQRARTAASPSDARAVA